MSEAHTTGPWEATDLNGKPVNDPAVMSAKHCVATVWINDISRKQAAANARLMAAAPDMLAALKEQHHALDIVFSMLVEADPKFMPTKSAVWPLFLQGIAAIAKAEGRTP